MEDNNFYVYLHTFKNARKYVGKGKNDRSIDFRNRSKFWKRNFNKYGEPEVTIVSGLLTEDEAIELEMFCIEEHIVSGYRLGDTLINFTTGGEGISGYSHTERAKKIIGERSKELWKDPEYRSNLKEKFKEVSNTEERKRKRSAASKKLWENPGYRKAKIKSLYELWQDPDHVSKMSKRMTGSNNPSARRANIYDYKTDELIAENVVSAEWARENGYSRPKLQVTTKADRSKKSSKDNPHHHKGVYMRYTDEK